MDCPKCGQSGVEKRKYHDGTLNGWDYWDVKYICSCGHEWWESFRTREADEKIQT